jgi:prepilin-type N-terminal cleavage/methylation domain-containing protein
MSIRRSARLMPPFDAGFTLVEIMAVLALAVIAMAIAVPVVQTAVQRMTFNGAARLVGSEIRATRYAAVAKNRTMLLRFDCPAAGSYRMVELTGVAAIDGAADRCSSMTFPYPDATPGAVPDNDGPIRFLPPGVTFSQSSTLTFDATGRAAAAATIELAFRQQRQSITVATNGRVVE